MFTHVSLWGILLSTVAAMAIGGVWYSPLLFGTPWMNAIGLTKKEMKARTNRALSMLVVVYAVAAYVLSLFTNYYHAYHGGGKIIDALITSTLVWLGFGLTTILAHGVFEPRDNSVLYINAGNRLVTLTAMGLIIGAFWR